MMADAAKRIATYADIEALPPNVVGEIIHGALVTHPRPSPIHAAAHADLIGELSGPYRKGKGGPGGWRFLTEPELQLGSNLVVPDVAGWKSERLNPIPRKGTIEIAPDWLCEILSPSTENYDKNEKREIYAMAGVGHIWFLDPRAMSLECFQNVAGRWLLTNTFTGKQTVSAQPFEAATFPLNVLFQFDDFEKSPE
jgi:Uma2 family endonuclease